MFLIYQLIFILFFLYGRAITTGRGEGDQERGKLWTRESALARDWVLLKMVSGFLQVQSLEFGVFSFSLYLFRIQSYIKEWKFQEKKKKRRGKKTVENPSLVVLDLACLPLGLAPLLVALVALLAVDRPLLVCVVLPRPPPQ